MCVSVCFVLFCCFLLFFWRACYLFNGGFMCIYFLIWEVLYTWVVMCGVGFFCWVFYNLVIVLKIVHDN